MWLRRQNFLIRISKKSCRIRKRRPIRREPIVEPKECFVVRFFFPHEWDERVREREGNSHVCHEYSLSRVLARANKCRSLSFLFEGGYMVFMNMFAGKRDRTHIHTRSLANRWWERWSAVRRLLLVWFLRPRARARPATLQCIVARVARWLKFQSIIITKDRTRQRMQCIPNEEDARRRRLQQCGGSSEGLAAEYLCSRGLSWMCILLTSGTCCEILINKSAMGADTVSGTNLSFLMKKYKKR